MQKTEGHGGHSHDHSHHDHHGHAHHQQAAPGAPTQGGKVKDPVCGMDVDPNTAKHMATHAGQHFYFCSGGCKAKFEADPKRYVAPRAETKPADPGAIYTCPMHPEIRQIGPGACPI